MTIPWFNDGVLTAMVKKKLLAAARRLKKDAKAANIALDDTFIEQAAEAVYQKHRELVRDGLSRLNIERFWFNVTPQWKGRYRAIVRSILPKKKKKVKA